MLTDIQEIKIVNAIVYIFYTQHKADKQIPTELLYVLICSINDSIMFAVLEQLP